MGDTTIRRVSLDRAFAAALFAIVISVISSVAGYYLADTFLTGSSSAVSFRYVDPYLGCEIFPEFVSRAAQICRVVLLQAILLWIAPYTRFEKPLTAAVFIDRGLSLGLALRFVIADCASTTLSVLLLLHTLITAIWILFVYSLRDASTVRPLKDTCTHFLIASGFSFVLYIASPWIL